MNFTEKETFRTRSFPAELKIRESTTENPKIEGYFAVFGDIYDMGYGLT